MARAISLSATVPERVDPAVSRFMRNVQAIIDDPLFHAHVTSDVEGTVAPNVRRLTLRIRNRRNDALVGGFLVHLWFALTPGGDPQGTQTVTFQSGTVLETVVGAQQWRVLTDDSGQIVMDVLATGAATRYVQAFVHARIDTSEGLVWA